MIVKIKVFSVLQDIFRSSEIRIEIDSKDRVSVRELITYLIKLYPELSELMKNIPVIVLVNGEVVSDNHEIHENDEIALIPPSSGGL